ncbi:RBBP8 N-terminal-like protein [Ascaphus truei]|uniref:RBBP8 N-terminal-like protein n=1 Tax=Ascaphus truei TaxID=8439 RepID=UPI003F5AB42B
MATDSFTEAVHRLKEIHEKEVLGLQAKLTELTMEKCRDTQIIEELFAKNHLLREQHKVLNENIKVLENRLRAGLCDRCTVTQELAKRKQQEFENSHFHSLQQISSLSNEMNNLKKENRSLLDELKKAKVLDDKNRHPKAFTPQSGPAPESPRPLISASRKNGLDKPLSKDSEAQEKLSDLQMSEGAKSSLVLGQDTRLFEMSMAGAQNMHPSAPNQQRISNQLHGTIAVMRPGSRSGHMGTVTSPSFIKQTSNHEIHTRRSRVDSYDATSQLDSQKHATPEEQFCLLRQHFLQRRLGQRGHGISADGASRYLLAKSREAELSRKRSQDDWEDRATMAELHGAVLYMSEQGYKGRLTQPDQREKLQYILTRHQQNQGQMSPSEAPKSQGSESQEDGGLSLLQVLGTRWKSNKSQDNQPEDDWEEKRSRLECNKCAEPDKRGQEEATPDRPLDLSDAKRGELSHRSNNRREQTGRSEMYSPTFSNKSSPTTRVPSPDLSHAESEEATYKTFTRLPVKSPFVGEHEKDGRTSSNEEDIQDAVIDYKPCSEMSSDAVTRKRPTRGHKRERETQPGEEEEEEEQEERVVQSPQKELDETDTSYSETDTESLQHAQTGKLGHVYTQDETQGENKWRRRGSDAWGKASTKSATLRKKARDLPAGDISQGDGDDMRGSASSSKGIARETQA